MDELKEKVNSKDKLIQDHKSMIEKKEEEIRSLLDTKGKAFER